MGYAIARVGSQRGHQVTLVSGPVAIDPPRGVTVLSVTTAAEMAAACKKAFRTADAAIMTAAVCDYRPVQRSPHKLAKKPKTKRVLLEPTEDIAASLGRRKGRRLLIGFAMEDTKNARLKAERKLKKKNCDLIVLNGIENVGSDEALVELYTPMEGWSRPMRGTKAAIARRLVQLIEMRVASEF